ncbi:hypothetical protein P885DRAFT_57742 [Corynascus similis CBS 632.67]
MAGGRFFFVAKLGWCACCGDAVRVLGGGEDSKVREDVVSFEAVEMALDKEVLRVRGWRASRKHLGFSGSRSIAPSQSACVAVQGCGLCLRTSLSHSPSWGGGAFAGDRKSPFSPQRNRLGVK